MFYKVFFPPPRIWGFWGGNRQKNPQPDASGGGIPPSQTKSGGEPKILPVRDLVHLQGFEAKQSIFGAFFDFCDSQNGKFFPLAPSALANCFLALFSGDARKNMAFVSPFV